MHPEFGMLRGLLHSTWISMVITVLYLYSFVPRAEATRTYTHTRTLKAHLSFLFLLSSLFPY
ncbi:hypothetical protein BDV34DRAFT_193320, partial [Aspergillus parasiticus]